MGDCLWIKIGGKEPKIFSEDILRLKEQGLKMTEISTEKYYPTKTISGVSEDLNHQDQIVKALQLRGYLVINYRRLHISIENGSYTKS